MQGQSYNKPLDILRYAKDGTVYPLWDTLAVTLLHSRSLQRF